MASDFMRPIILNKYGGFYIDIDYTLLRNVDWLIKNTDFFANYAVSYSPTAVTNAKFASR